MLAVLSNLAGLLVNVCARQADIKGCPVRVPHWVQVARHERITPGAPLFTMIEACYVPHTLASVFAEGFGPAKDKPQTPADATDKARYVLGGPAIGALGTCAVVLLYYAI